MWKAANKSPLRNSERCCRRVARELEDQPVIILIEASRFNLNLRKDVALLKSMAENVTRPWLVLQSSGLLELLLRDVARQ